MLINYKFGQYCVSVKDLDESSQYNGLDSSSWTCSYTIKRGLHPLLCAYNLIQPETLSFSFSSKFPLGYVDL